jgi:hypothetical protein
LADCNPYESPREMCGKLSTLSPEMARIARNMRAVCMLYVAFGAVESLGAIVLSFSRPPLDVPRPVAIGVMFTLGSAGLIGGLGMLRRYDWGVPVCRVTSVLYLLLFPIGTILGGYGLLNIGKKTKLLRAERSDNQTRADWSSPPVNS